MNETINEIIGNHTSLNNLFEYFELIKKLLKKNKKNHINWKINLMNKLEESDILINIIDHTIIGTHIDISIDIGKE